jgi:hypothetical protein
MVRATDSISALLKLRVMGSPRLGLALLLAPVIWACTFKLKVAIAPVNSAQAAIEIIAFQRALVTCLNRRCM